MKSARQSVERIIADGKQVADIVSRIRCLAKKAPVEREGLEINEVVLQVIELTRSEMSNSGVVVRTRMADGLPRIWEDRVQLQQVILSLIAMSEVAEGSRELLIGTSRTESSSVLVTVSDSGPGLPQANLDRLFDAF